MSEPKRLCIYHGACTDGVAAAWAYHCAYPGATFYPGVYGNPPPWGLIAEHDIVAMVDFSYHRAIINQMIHSHRNTRFEVYDHHASAKDALEPLLEAGELHGVFDMDRCGAMITWDEVCGPAVSVKRPPLLDYIDARDRWVKPTPTLGYNLDHVTFGLRTISHADPIDFNEWTMVMNDVGYLARAGASVYKYYQQLVEAAVAEARYVTFDGIENVPVVNTSYALASDVGHVLAHGSEAKMACMWWQQADGRYVASLRSTPDGPLVSDIAVKYGGGGHPHAAGFKINDLPWSRP